MPWSGRARSPSRYILAREAPIQENGRVYVAEAYGPAVLAGEVLPRAPPPARCRRLPLLVCEVSVAGRRASAAERLGTHSAWCFGCRARVMTDDERCVCLASGCGSAVLCLSCNEPVVRDDTLPGGFDAAWFGNDTCKSCASRLFPH